MLAQTFSCIAALLAALLAIVVTSPLVLPAVLLVGLAFGRIVCDYQPSAAEAKRLVSVLHGPVMVHMLEAQAATLPLALTLPLTRRAVTALAHARASAGRRPLPLAASP